MTATSPPPTIVAADLSPAELWSLLVDLHRSGIPLPPLVVADLTPAEWHSVLATLKKLRNPLPVVVTPGEGEGGGGAE